MDREDHYEVACPLCEAPSGDNCRAASGKPRNTVHAARKRVAETTAAYRVAARWNRTHPVGTPVTAYPGARPEVASGGSVVTGFTTCTAWVLGGHTPVVMVSGHAACIALTHVDPR